MRSGTLRHRVTLQKPAAGDNRDAVGEPQTVWETVGTYWASVVPLSTGERHLAAQSRTYVTHRVTLRYSSELAAIDGSWRVVFGTRHLPIEGVRNIDERNREFELVCVEGMKQE
jgi:SPP1 family predicted phage head-tail adaptor